MIRKLACAVVVLTLSVGFVLADDFFATITAVKEGKVTYQKYKKSTEKGKKGEKDGDPVTLPVAADATIAKGKFNKEDKKFEAGDKIEDGLKNEMFTKIGDNGMGAMISTDADNKTITKIMLFTPKKGKKGAN
jgi:hypothetical protein